MFSSYHDISVRKMHMEPESETLCFLSTYCDQLLTAELKYYFSVIQVPVL